MFSVTGRSEVFSDVDRPLTGETTPRKLEIHLDRDGCIRLLKSETVEEVQQLIAWADGCMTGTRASEAGSAKDWSRRVGSFGPVLVRLRSNRVSVFKPSLS